MSETTHPREEALYTVCLLAAFADGAKSDHEREELKQIGETLLPPDYHPAALYQKVLLGRIDATRAAAALDAPEWRQLAYEMAVKVCDADGVTSEAERTFLAELAGHLGIQAPAALEIVRKSDAVVAATLDGSEPALPLPLTAPAAAAGNPEADSLILKYAILNGALELLPETLATVAIIPLQMKLVNAVGKHHGISMDRRQIAEFAGAAGIGATSQVLEGFARKLVGGLGKSFGNKMLGKTVGSLAGKAADQITSSAFSFASTFAIGHLAHRYYANGRSWSGIDARATLEKLKDDARPLHSRLLPQIQDQAKTLDYAKVLSMVRGRNP